MTLTDSEVEYINTEAFAKKRTTALQIQTLNRISGLPDLEPTSPISADNKINFSSRQACPERTLSKVENVRLSRSAGNKVCSGRVMKTNRIQITIIPSSNPVGLLGTGLFKVNLEFSFSFPGFSFSGLDLVFKSGFLT